MYRQQLNGEVKSSLVSVVILNYNGEKWIDQCIHSLERQIYAPIEIIVVDNASTDKSRDIIARHNVRLLALDENLGFSRGNNEGGKIAFGKYILFVNGDMRFESNFVGELINGIEKDKSIFSADARQYSWEGDTVIHSGTVLRKASFLRGNFLPGLTKDVTSELEPGSEIPHSCGSNFMVRRRMFQELGGFDPSFIFDWDDVDLGWRAWMLGYRSIYVPTAVCYHVGGGSFSADKRFQALRRLSGRKNFLRFVCKTMPLSMIASVLLREVFYIGWFLISGKAWLSWVEIQALVDTWRVWQEIHAERRKVMATARISSRQLIRRFLSAQQLRVRQANGTNTSSKIRSTSACLQKEATKANPPHASVRTPSISVVIATYRRDRELRDVVKQLLNHNYPDFEIIIVDQTPRHDTRTLQFLASAGSRIRYFELDQPNTVRAEALGVAQASGEVVLFLDDDVVIPEDLMARHAENYRDKNVGGVGGLVLHLGEKPVEILHPLCTYEEIGYYFFSHAYSKRIEVPNARGCNMSFRREAILRAGGLDECFHTHQWELDLCLRVHHVGLKIVHDPEAKVLHLAAARGGSRGRHGDPVSLLTDFHLFIGKHHSGMAGAFLRWRLFRDRVLGMGMKQPFFIPLQATRYFHGWLAARRKMRGKVGSE